LPSVPSFSFVFSAPRGRAVSDSRRGAAIHRRECAAGAHARRARPPRVSVETTIFPPRIPNRSQFHNE
jgi:hypothetical protein